jgi:hypothetical protein
MTTLYDDRFYDWVNRTARRSARVVLPLAAGAASVQSVADVGCGQGAWLDEWGALGVKDVLGVDGDYVARDRLLIPSDRFVAADLSKPFRAERRFDLAQSLEVGEHLPPASSEDFVDSLCALSDVVLFSAAQPGQGGEGHVNERLPSQWAALFARRGYRAFDALRPELAERSTVAPWYRFNVVLYANAAGEERLAPAALASRVDDLARLDLGGDLLWKVRKIALRPLPVDWVTRLSKLRYRVACALETATGKAA